jgi:hypothetical protein
MGITVLRASICASALLAACGGRLNASSQTHAGTGATSGAPSTGAASSAGAGAGAGAGTGAGTGAGAGAATGAGTGAFAGASGSLAATGANDPNDSGTGSFETSSTCPGPSRYMDPALGGTCVCAPSAFSFDGGACTCEGDVPKLCTYSNKPPQCIDPTTDPNNCGECGVTCKPKAACINGVCGNEPTPLVAPAPGCISMHVVYEAGFLYWADMGHGSLNRISTAGGPVTALASSLHLAAIQELPFSANSYSAILFPGSLPVGVAILVRSGTVYWVSSADDASPSDAGVWYGGVGTTIMSAAANSPPRVLLSAALDPGPSPVSSTAGAQLELPGIAPPIDAIALSPDGSTLYFAAGTRFYSIPSTGARAPGDVRYLGYTEGPEHGSPTALAADSRYLYDLTTDSTIEILDPSQGCDADAAAHEECPVRISQDQVDSVPDTLEVSGDFVWWVRASSVQQGSVAQALSGHFSGDPLPQTAEGNNITGFAVGSGNAYFGEPGQDGSGYVERGAVPPYEAAFAPNAIVLARGEPVPTSFALDGAHVYFTTSNCDIEAIADSPQ